MPKNDDGPKKPKEKGPLNTTNFGNRPCKNTATKQIVQRKDHRRKTG